MKKLIILLICLSFCLPALAADPDDNKDMYDDHYVLTNLKATKDLTGLEKYIARAEELATIIGAKGKVQSYEIDAPNSFWRSITIYYDSGDAVGVDMDVEGRVRYIGFEWCDGRGDRSVRASKDYERDVKAQEAMREKLKELLDKINPGMTDLYQELTFHSAWGNGKDDYIQFVGVAKDGNSYDDGFILQVKSDGSVLLAYYTMGGNG